MPSDPAKRSTSVLHWLPRIRLEEGGVVRAVLDLAGALHEAGEDVALATSDPRDAPEPWKAGDGPRLVRMPEPEGRAGLFSRRQRAAVRDAVSSFDVLHLHAPWTLSNRQFAAAAVRTGTPYVFSVHGMLDDWSMAQRTLKKRLYLALGGRAMLERAAVVHCTASFEQRQAQRWIGRAESIVIPLVLDLEPFRELPGPEDAARAFGLSDNGAPRVLFLSRIHEKKGLDRLIRAVGILKRAGTGCTLLAAGPGEEAYIQSLRALAEREGLGDDARFLGMVSGARKVSLYEAADVFALPTSQENFGFVAPESMACATPVVTTKGVDIWPELESSGGAVIVDNDPEAIAEALGDLLRDEQRRREMGRKGREWVLNTLDPAVVRGQYVELYRRVASGKDAS